MGNGGLIGVVHEVVHVLLGVLVRLLHEGGEDLRRGGFGCHGDTTWNWSQYPLREHSLPNPSVSGLYPWA